MSFSHFTGPSRILRASLLACAALIGAAAAAEAVEIGVANYGSGPVGFPYTVAVEKGLFKQAGVDITGIRGSNGGGSDVRIMLAGELPFFDGTIGPVVAAIQQGADLKIVSMSLNNSATSQWAVMPSSPIQSWKDLKGKRVGYTNAQSYTQAMDLWLMQKFGYKETDLTLVATGGFGPAITLLEHGGIDVASITEPTISENMSSKKYRIILSGDDATQFPSITNTLGFVSNKYAKEHPEIVKAIIQGRRLGVEYMTKNRKESAAIIAKSFKLDPAIIEVSLDRLIDKGTTEGVPAFSPGTLSFAALERGLELARLVGTIKGDVNLKTMVDDSYLAPDLRALTK